MSSFRELRQAMELLFIPLFVGFVDIINYYPNGDSPYSIYGDGSDPFFISFSFFNFIVVSILIIIKQYISDIYVEGGKKEENEEKNINV